MTAKTYIWKKTGVSVCEVLSYLQMLDHGISYDHASQYLLICFPKHTNTF